MDPTLNPNIQTVAPSLYSATPLQNNRFDPQHNQLARGMSPGTGTLYPRERVAGMRAAMVAALHAMNQTNPGQSHVDPGLQAGRMDPNNPQAAQII